MTVRVTELKQLALCLVHSVNYPLRPGTLFLNVALSVKVVFYCCSVIPRTDWVALTLIYGDCQHSGPHYSDANIGNITMCHLRSIDNLSFLTSFSPKPLDRSLRAGSVTPLEEAWSKTLDNIQRLRCITSFVLTDKILTVTEIP